MARLVQRLTADLTRAGHEIEVVEQSEVNTLLNRRAFEGVVLISRDTQDPSRLLNVPSQGGHAHVEEPNGAHFDVPMKNAWDR